MIGASVRFAHRGRHTGRAVAGTVLGALVAAVLVGLFGMHGLTAPTRPMPATAAGHATGAAAPHGAEPVTGEGDEAPDPHHSTHVGPVCQSAALGVGFQAPVLPPAVDAAPVQLGHALPSRATTPDGGTGCGPPSQYELSILRL